MICRIKKVERKEEVRRREELGMYMMTNISNGEVQVDKGLWSILLVTDQPSWHRRIAHDFIPRVIIIKKLRLFVFLTRDCSYYTHSLTKLHFIGLLIRNYKPKWYQSWIVGFEVWY